MMSKLKNLWQTILERALADYARGPDDQEIKDYIFCAQEDAERWLMSEGNKPGSFVWVCDMLGLEHTAVRRRAREMKNEPADPDS